MHTTARTPIAPSNFLALSVGAASVRNADLEDLPVAACKLCGDLRFEAKTIFFDGDGLNDLAPECLVTGLHIGEVEIGEHVRKQREQTIAERVPKVKHSVRPATQEA